MNQNGVSDRAAELYASTLVWDDHSGFEPHVHSDLKELQRWRRAGVDYLSIGIGYDVMTWHETIKVLAIFRAWLSARPGEFVLARTAAEITGAKREGKLAATFDIEGMNALAGEVAMVGLYYELGVRQMLFAYNRNNDAGGGCHDTDIGLTAFGRDVVQEMNRVGMLVDCSHSSYRTTMEAMEISTAPVVFSHSNPVGRWDHPRNITDEQIKACAQSGGVIGINGLGIFLGDNDIRVGTIAEHIDYVAELVGVAHVGIGLDYAFEEEDLGDLLGGNADIWPPGYGYDTPDIQFAAPAYLPAIADELLRRGYSDKDVCGVLGANFFRVASSVWK
jgi:membrane dipeptidase